MDTINAEKLEQVCSLLIYTANIRRFQAHDTFVSVCFDVLRLRTTKSQINLHTNRKSWPSTQKLINSLNPPELEYAAAQARKYETITNPKVRELLNLISRVGSVSPGSNEKKSYMLMERKSLVVYYGCPTIYMTINPGDLYSPLSLKYCSVEIDIDNFTPELYDYGQRLKVLHNNPLAVVEYFRNLVDGIMCVLKQGLFGEMSHHYGIFEYQGRKTPHIHMQVSIPF